MAASTTRSRLRFNCACGCVRACCLPAVTPWHRPFRAVDGLMLAAAAASPLHASAPATAPFAASCLAHPQQSHPLAAPDRLQQQPRPAWAAPRRPAPLARSASHPRSTAPQQLAVLSPGPRCCRGRASAAMAASPPGPGRAHHACYDRMCRWPLAGSPRAAVHAPAGHAGAWGDEPRAAPGACAGPGRTLGGRLGVTQQSAPLDRHAACACSHVAHSARSAVHEVRLHARAAPAAPRHGLLVPCTATAGTAPGSSASDPARPSQTSTSLRHVQKPVHLCQGGPPSSCA